MSITLRTSLLLVLGAASATGCTAILGGFDFEGEATGTGGSGGAPACAEACAAADDCAGAVSTCFEHACEVGCCTVRPVAGACSLDGGHVCGDVNGSFAGTCVECNEATDCPPESCMVRSCVAHACGSSPAPAGDPCTEGGKVCDGTGSCVECVSNTDCTDAAAPVCNQGHICVAASCGDGEKNGDESDTDCGGATCPKCDVGKTCNSATDCVGGPNGSPTCEGTCGFSCTTGYDDCDGSIGCETDITTKDHCGSCTNACSAYCTAGTCNDPIAITAAYDHTCAILADGSVWCWGFNQVGEVGDGTKVDKLVPTKITLPLSATAISGGGVYLGGTEYSAHTCALLSNKTLRCWGSNANGELGKGNTTDLVGPQMPGVSDIAQVSVRGAHTCATATNNELRCWGRNQYGQIGNGVTSSTPVSSPTLITTGVTSVSAGAYHTCGIKTDGKLYCWGNNYYGQLGLGNNTPTNVPTVVPGLTNVLEVASGRFSTCARTSVGVYCWGYNAGGDLGIGSLTDHNTPQPLSLTGVTRLAFGDDHAGAVTGSGLFMWGVNNDGQLGDGTAVLSQVPKEILTPPNVALLSLSERSSCALTTNHQMYCWGYNAYGQLGDGTMNSTSVAVPVVWP